MANDKNQIIIIVGAGIFGLGTALTLKEQGYRNVTVLDRALLDAVRPAEADAPH